MLAAELGVLSNSDPEYGAGDWELYDSLYDSVFEPLRRDTPEARALQKRWQAEQDAYVAYLRTLDFVEDVGQVRGFNISIKEEYYDQFDAREFKFEDFKYWSANIDLSYSVPRTSDYSSTLEMTVILKEAGVEQAEAAAEHFRTLDFIEWARVDY
jgi:hypothetical protein